MEPDQGMKGSLNRDYVKSYCASYTNNILDRAYKESPQLKGDDLKALCNPKQINFHLLKSIFLQWEAEVNKFRNPYFDHDAPAVQNALKKYMEVLSRHIKIDKGSLRPLLQQAVEETLYLVFSPLYYFENFLWPGKENSLKLKELLKLQKFLRINAAFFEELVLPWREVNKLEISLTDYRNRLKPMAMNWDQWEDTESYIQSFSKVVALNTNSLWNLPQQEETESSELNNVNQRFAQEVMSLNDTLQKDQTTLVEQLTKKVEQIESVKKYLNINQKFRFVNELYGGDTSEFEKIIERIDQCNSYHEAMNTLDNSSLRSQWDMSNEVVLELIDLVSRRFSAPGPAYDGRPTSIK